MESTDKCLLKLPLYLFFSLCKLLHNQLPGTVKSADYFVLCSEAEGHIGGYVEGITFYFQILGMNNVASTYSLTK